LKRLTFDGPTRSLAGSGVGFGALPPDRQAAAMPQAPVATEVKQALDIHADFTPQVALNIQFGDFRPQGIHLPLIQLTNFGTLTQAGHFAKFLRRGSANAVYIGKRYNSVLVIRYIDSSNTSHSIYSN
jgi:hypothetical protein